MSGQDLTAPLKLLPHGESFRFIHALTELEPGKRATARFRVPEDAAFLDGHFPGDPMMPGVLMVEAIAQLGGVVAQCDPEIPPLERLKLTAVSRARITGTASPGETIIIAAEVVARHGQLIEIRGNLDRNQETIVEARVTLTG